MSPYSLDHSFTRQNISMVTATIKDDQLGYCLDVPSSKQREIREKTSTPAEYREGLINYFIQYSPYATWSDLSGRLYYNKYPEAVAAARRFIRRTPGKYEYTLGCNVQQSHFVA